MNQIRMFLMMAVFFATLILSVGIIDAAPIFSEDFSEPHPLDPYGLGTVRWTSESQSDYPFFWAYLGWDPATVTGHSFNLPFSDWDTMYVFSTGWKRLWSTDTTVNSAASYAVWHDFIIKGSSTISDISIGQYIQRQAADPAQCYEARFAVGGNGTTSWAGDYGWSGYGGSALQVDTWYTLLTEIEVGAGEVTMQSRILLLDYLETPTVLSTSPVFTDSSSGRLTDARGYGLYVSLPGSRYWNQSVELDNLVVDSSYYPSDTPRPPRYGSGDSLFFPGDISGPEGIPDHYLDLYDFIAFGQDWLNCTDPADPDNCQ